jgi:hypothetical protein
MRNIELQKKLVRLQDQQRKAENEKSKNYMATSDQPCHAHRR